MRATPCLNRVPDLIDPMYGDWDRSLIYEVLWEEDAKYILSIMLKSGMGDYVVWHFDSKR
jgi:hypothetical protein